jgi:hypothetical protein
VPVPRMLKNPDLGAHATSRGLWIGGNPSKLDTGPLEYDISPAVNNEKRTQVPFETGR